MTRPVAHDPFRPHVEVPPGSDDGDGGDEVTQPDPDATSGPVGDGLDDMLKPELMTRAAQLGLATWGTKADLIERIRASQ